MRQLLLFGEISVAYRENQTKHINNYVRKTKINNVTAGGAHNKDC